MQTATYMARKFGPAASTVALSITGGAVLRGIWISAKGTAPTFVVYDAAASVTGSNVVPSFIPAAVGWNELGGIGLGTGLTFKCASCSGTVVYQPASW